VVEIALNYAFYPCQKDFVNSSSLLEMTQNCMDKRKIININKINNFRLTFLFFFSWASLANFVNIVNSLN